MTALHLRPREPKWWTLGAVAFGLFMIMLDNTVVNVALPSIQRDLGVGLSELEWIVTGYALTLRRADAHRRQARRHATAGGGSSCSGIVDLHARVARLRARRERRRR